MDILLADDHAMVRDGLVPFLERLQPGARVVEAATLPEAIAAAKGCDELGLVILDLYMPGMNGLQGLEEMTRQFPGIPVVILSGSTKAEDAFRAIEKGAAGYVPKTMRGQNIIGALGLVLSGERYVPPFLFEHREQRGDSGPDTAAATPLDALTARERDIVEMVVDGAPNKVIARALDLQEVTVKAHLRNIFRKLDVANRTEAARVAMMAGVTGRMARA
jgi:DNA-binding NarL/FixJ family response regulator